VESLFAQVVLRMGATVGLLFFWKKMGQPTFDS